MSADHTRSHHSASRNRGNLLPECSLVRTADVVIFVCGTCPHFLSARQAAVISKSLHDYEIKDPITCYAVRAFVLRSFATSAGGDSPARWRLSQLHHSRRTKGAF